MERGDCLSFMRGMDNRSVDAIICDPPYDAKTHANVMSMKGGSAGEVQLGFEALSAMAHVREMLRVSKGWVLCFCALEQLGEYQMFAGDSWVRAGAWDRISGAPQLSGDRPAQGCDGIAIMWAGGGRKSWNGGGARAIWRVPRANGEHHPTEKPVALMEILLRQFTNYGDVVLDPYAGSGTTGVAAVRLGRNFIGVEILDEHYQTAMVRLRGTNEQMTLTYRPKKKAKQLKLIGGSDGKAKGEEVEDQAQGISDHGLDGPREVPQVSPRSEAAGEAYDGRDPVVDRCDADETEQAQDEDEGPEVYGEEAERRDAVADGQPRARRADEEG